MDLNKEEEESLVVMEEIVSNDKADLLASTILRNETKVMIAKTTELYNEIKLTGIKVSPVKNRNEKLLYFTPQNIPLFNGHFVLFTNMVPLIVSVYNHGTVPYLIVHFQANTILDFIFRNNMYFTDTVSIVKYFNKCLNNDLGNVNLDLFTNGYKHDIEEMKSRLAPYANTSCYESAYILSLSSIIINETYSLANLTVGGVFVQISKQRYLRRNLKHKIKEPMVVSAWSKKRHQYEIYLTTIVIKKLQDKKKG